MSDSAQTQTQAGETVNNGQSVNEGIPQDNVVDDSQGQEALNDKRTATDDNANNANVEGTEDDNQNPVPSIKSPLYYVSSDENGNYNLVQPTDPAESGAGVGDDDDDDDDDDNSGGAPTTQGQEGQGRTIARRIFEAVLGVPIVVVKGVRAREIALYEAIVENSLDTLGSAIDQQAALIDSLRHVLINADDAKQQTVTAVPRKLSARKQVSGGTDPNQDKLCTCDTVAPSSN